jgi:hypothetical protein
VPVGETETVGKYTGEMASALGSTSFTELLRDFLRWGP